MLGEVSSYAERNHSIGLLPHIQDLLARLQLKPKDLQSVAVGQGPGSYTGVRIAVSVAKTFAWSLSLGSYWCVQLRSNGTWRCYEGASMRPEMGRPGWCR